MAMKTKRIDSGKYNAFAWSFYKEYKELQQMQKEVNELKSEFESEMERLFAQNEVKAMKFGGRPVSREGVEQVLNVKMVERTSIVWDAEKLEKRVTKPIARQVIKKEYSIQNMKGLTQYLSSCGVDPEIFKKFIVVTKTVDEAEVERLGDLGKLSVKDISGCYIVKCQKPYFTLSVKKEECDGKERE